MERLYLTISSAAGTRSIVAGPQPISVGRHPQNTLVLTDDQASRFHCVIQNTDSGLLVKDLDSRNGTKINGQRVSTAFLRPGDVLTIGATQIRLESDRPIPPPTAPQPAAQAAEPDPLEAINLAGVQAPPSRPTQSPSPQEDLAADLIVQTASESGKSMIDLTSRSGRLDDEKFLPVLAESLPDKSFEMQQIALVNRRGTVVHKAEEHQPRQRMVEGSGDAVAVLRYILLICIRTRATDVHIEPRPDDFALRLRIDGSLVDIVRLTRAMGVRVCTMIKVLCDIDVQFRNIIQEGHFTSLVPGRKIDYRVSFTPAMYGQKLVVRVLDATAAPAHAKDLRLPLWMLEELQHAMRMDQGMILVCGPTGSGKTTTLYALLRDCGLDHRNVVTIEDPVEIEIEGVTQVQVNEDRDNTFPNLLRSMLRQDPDVMMVGEIRDSETARIAMQAAMTGHLVFSTLHTRDAIGTIFRLLDLGVEPYLVASSLNIVVSQRLARELCAACKRPVLPTADQLRKMGPAAAGVRELFVPAGCPRCLNTGFSGRRAFFEMLVSNEEFREIILKQPTPRQIEQALASSRFTKLAVTGYQLVAQGVTAFDEIERAVGM